MMVVCLNGLITLCHLVPPLPVEVESSPSPGRTVPVPRIVPPVPVAPVVVPPAAVMTPLMQARRDKCNKTDWKPPVSNYQPKTLNL